MKYENISRVREGLGVLHHMFTYDKLEGHSKKRGNGNGKKYFHVNGSWRVAHVNDVPNSKVACLGFHVRFSSHVVFFFIKREKEDLLRNYIWSHAWSNRDLFKSKLKFSTVKIAFPVYISICAALAPAQTTIPIFHRYRQITSFSQKIQRGRRRVEQRTLLFLLLFLFQYGNVLFRKICRSFVIVSLSEWVSEWGKGRAHA